MSLDSDIHERGPALAWTYDAAFFDDLAAGVAASAAVIVPIVFDLLHPSSVLDVGCGRGTWLRAFVERGVDDIVGVDGPHVPRADLDIPAPAFVAHDLSAPLSLGRSFDLVVSLEVAEHLDVTLADAFVASLAAHGRAVLFSAAIPFQGGAGHVNEAWPSAWAARFAAHGLVPVDVVRPAVWEDDSVAFWYAQNTLLYVEEGRAADLRNQVPAAMPLDVVHPALHLRSHTTPPPAPAPYSLSRLLRELPAAGARAVRHRLPRRDEAPGR
jgi:SAM-dependent methyltransferase